MNKHYGRVLSVHDFDGLLNINAVFFHDVFNPFGHIHHSPFIREGVIVANKKEESLFGLLILVKTTIEVDEIE